MTEKIRMGYLGQLTYDGRLKLDKVPLIDRIIFHLPLTSISDTVKDFGGVEITITFNDYEPCPHCGIIMKRSTDV